MKMLSDLFTEGLWWRVVHSKTEIIDANHNFHFLFNHNWLAIVLISMVHLLDFVEIINFLSPIDEVHLFMDSLRLGF